MTENDIKDIDFGFTPSEYQLKIFDFVRHGIGNAVISALAGSGKTSTIVAAMKLIPKKTKVMFLAFNKSIADELEVKLKDYENIEVRTSHSLGYAMIRRNTEEDVQVDEYKYATYLRQNIAELTTIPHDIKLTETQLISYTDNILALLNFSRYYLAQTKEDVLKMSVKYDIPILFDEDEMVLKLMDWGKKHLATVDYTDMVWIPVEENMNPKGFQKDFVFIDECQDQSVMSIQLFLKCFKRGTRFVAVGDKNQCVYAFCGSSEESFDFMQTQPKTTILNLPICYRCPQKVIDLANIMVKDMLPCDHTIEGEIKQECHLSILKDGDMVLSRSKAPLFLVYTKLMKRNVPCYIKGDDMAEDLKKVLNSIEEQPLTFKQDGVWTRLYDELFIERNKMMQRYNLDYRSATLSSYILSKYDTIKSLETIGSGCKTKNELYARIEGIFKDKEGVILSTIHKAKGLEADNVYIVCRSSMPSKRAHHDWEKMQENNLIYVAYTRPKKVLGFISEKEVHPIGGAGDSDSLLDELKTIETAVCKELGKTPTEYTDDVSLARFNLRSGVTEVAKKEVPEKTIFNEPRQSNDELLSELDALL